MPKAKQPVKRSASDIFNQFRQDQLQEYKEAFAFIDSDKDGLISKNDLRDTWDALGRVYPDSDLDAMLKEATGPLNFTMFLRMICGRMTECESMETLKAAFLKFADEGSEKVHIDILKKYLTVFGEKLTEEELEEAIKEMDIDTKGNVDVGKLASVLAGQGE